MLQNTCLSQNIFDSVTYVNSFKKLYPALRMDTSLLQNELSAEEKLEGLSKVWSEARFNFANFDLLPYLNWDSAYRQFIPECLATKGMIDYYKVLKKFNRLLHDGHSRVVEPLYYFNRNNEYTPLVCQLINQQVVLTEILNSDSGYKQAKIGWVIEKIDGFPVQEYIQTNISPYLNYSTTQDSIARIYRYELLKGAINSSVCIDFRDENGQSVTKTFKRQSWDCDENPIQFSILKGNIGYLKINSFNTPRVVEIFDSIFSKVSSTDALIIDIRSNGGGSSNYGYEILGRLTEKSFFTSMNITRNYRPSYRAWGNDPVKIDISRWDWKPYKKYSYLKPIALLIGPSTYSAAEDFTVAFKAMNRGKMIGTSTGGSTGQPLGYNLPGGGIGFICSKRDVQPNGVEFVGIGIQPDIIAEPTISGVRKGIDEVLEKAIQIITKN
jgi:C-terminal processing protease CtpA/Prc